MFIKEIKSSEDKISETKISKELQIIDEQLVALRDVICSLDTRTKFIRTPNPDLIEKETFKKSIVGKTNSELLLKLYNYKDYLTDLIAYVAYITYTLEI